MKIKDYLYRLRWSLNHHPHGSIHQELIKEFHNTHDYLKKNNKNKQGE